jgi:hypothetical protein
MSTVRDRVRAAARAVAVPEKGLALEICQQRQRMLEADVEQPRSLRRRDHQPRKFEKRVAKAKGILIDRAGECNHGQTSFQRLPNCRGSDGVDYRST